MGFFTFELKQQAELKAVVVGLEAGCTINSVEKVLITSLFLGRSYDRPSWLLVFNHLILSLQQANMNCGWIMCARRIMHLRR